MQPPTDPLPKSPMRRFVLAGVATGIAALVTGFWKRGAPTELLQQPSGPKAPVGSAAAQSTETAVTETPKASEGLPTREKFLPHLHSQFQMRAETLGSTTPVELIEVGPEKRLDDRDHHINYVSFSLVFKGPKEMPAESQIFHLEHEMLGKMDLFLSPIGSYKDQVRYEAVFSERI